MQHKRKKFTKKRGTETHGHGSSKKHRGSGHRGGFGNAGSGKRGDQKMMKIHGGKRLEYLGKHGFKPVSSIDPIVINIDTIEQKLDSWVEEGKAKKDKDTYEINLKDMGYDKLLSKGLISKKYKISVEFASDNVCKKIKEAGGEVILLAEKKNEE